jgi:hypothetical protein
MNDELFAELIKLLSYIMLVLAFGLTLTIFLK